MQHTPPPKPEGFIDRSPNGFAKRNGLCSVTVYKLLKEGSLKGRKVGRRTLITAQDEQDWLDNLPPYKAEAI